MVNPQCKTRDTRCNVPSAQEGPRLFQTPNSELRTANVVCRRSFTKLMCYDSRLPPELAERLWTDAEGLVAAGTMLKAGERTTVVRLDAGRDSWVLKRFNLRGAFHTALHALLRSRARNNWLYGRRLCRSGIATPRPMAFLEYRFGPLGARSFVLTEFVPGTLLRDLLLCGDPAERMRVSTCAGFAGLWRRLGELRLTHGDTKSSNYVVTDDGRLWLVDLDGMRFHRFEGTFRLARRRDWRRFIKNWREAPRLADAFRDAVESDESTDPKRAPATLEIAVPFRRLLQATGLDTLEAVMNTTEGHLLRRLPSRENWRLNLMDEAGVVRGAFLKKHRSRSLWTWMRARLGRGPGQSAGAVEAHNMHELRRQGIPNMTLIAFGEQLHPDGRLFSFLLTEELAGFSPLDSFLPERFPARTDAHFAALRRLVLHVADLTRRFHRLGYNHRDLYACHYFIRETAPGRFDVNLIDLQRVQRRRWNRRRWIVKDLAQLGYSMPRRKIGCRWRMTFFKQYLGVRKLRPRDKRLLRSILRKQRRMEHKLGPCP